MLWRTDDARQARPSLANTSGTKSFQIVNHQISINTGDAVPAAAKTFATKSAAASFSLVSAIAIENCADLEALKQPIWGEGPAGRQEQGDTIGIDRRRPKHCPRSMVIALEGGAGNRTVRQAVCALCHG
jgi:hypothetical protein